METPLLPVCSGWQKWTTILPPLVTSVKWIAIAAVDPTMIDAIVISLPRNLNQHLAAISLINFKEIIGMENGFKQYYPVCCRTLPPRPTQV